MKSNKEIRTLAKKYIKTKSSIALLKEESDEYKEQLLTLMKDKNITTVSVTYNFKKWTIDRIESYTSITDIEKICRKLLTDVLKKHISDKATRKALTKDIGKKLVGFMRKDSFLITKIRTFKWYNKVVQEKKVRNPYLMVYDPSTGERL